MKKINLLIAIFLMVSLSAQEFKYGVTGNFHKGSIVGVHDVSKGAYGGTLGFFGQWPLVENDVYDSAWLYITPQLEYHMGGEIAKADQELFGIQRYSHDYVAMEVYLKWFFHKGNMKRDLFLFAGPRIEYLVRQDKKVDPGYDLAYYQYNLDSTVKKFGYGVSFGLGLKVSQQVEAYLRYDRGFSKVYPDNNNRNTYNRMLGLGFNFYVKENWW
ncbi:PorT family protein [Chryseobacterium sp. SNU WT5]|uniref:outer membrane beta-barrel protein n=1 Tax=Chryseobacterium sp. SNU WT5 TaxID=2594269 RepID=UPI00117E4BA5|nr:outer membrane beta-barrel protein [Chryseobacterium sp. SNU WT5]QDP85808.1 PorT family protein [Chryseobacterium sp. SNU WT5]